MFRKVVLAALAALPVLGWSSEELWLGLYMKGAPVGYSRTSSLTQADQRVTNTLTLFRAGLMGSPLDVKLASKTIAGLDGKPIAIEFGIESSGRKQTVEATFEASGIRCRIVNAGQVSEKLLEVPVGTQVVDDAMTSLLGMALPYNTKLLVLDPMTVSLVPTEIRRLGSRQITISGKSATAEAILIADPRGDTTVFLSSKGDLLKAVGPMQMEMRPLSRAEALNQMAGARVELTDPTKVPLSGDLQALTANRASYRIKGKLPKLPEGDHQTVRPTEEGWEIVVHPTSFDPAAKRGVAFAGWMEPSWNIPADALVFKELSNNLVRVNDGVAQASAKVARYVYETMVPNGGIGVLRDAREVLETREGVCRDYAVLTATLLRASGIPARVVAGLVHMNGSLYYHAWVEAYDGKHWVGVDSTLATGKVGTGHVKLSEGTVEQAFTFPVLDGVRAEVIRAQ